MKRVVLSIGNSKTIGTQVWTTTNLNVASFRNGKLFPKPNRTLSGKKPVKKVRLHGAITEETLQTVVTMVNYITGLQ